MRLERLYKGEPLMCIIRVIKYRMVVMIGGSYGMNKRKEKFTQILVCK